MFDAYKLLVSAHKRLYNDWIDEQAKKNNLIIARNEVLNNLKRTGITSDFPNCKTYEPTDTSNYSPATRNSCSKK
ncbi:MAG: hypothetical protein A3F11_05010 [Gammaproteobacteria bacterium RIFCSPHIGHO2_12_FULL_37_14]|nr:MAG: hypothetical protein A3F11_05010 [Gammaproteobacteria bacterium RIFCSPHIGHO2_12_FULL_37_14]